MGLQVPAIPLVEVVGKNPKGSPEQIGETCVNVGVTIVCPKPLKAKAIRNTTKMFFKLVNLYFV